MNDIKKEIQRFDRRMETFRKEGLCNDQAYDLASAMMDRDRDPHDDRRVCHECSGYQNQRCVNITDRYGKPSMPLRHILQRCEYFELRGVNIAKRPNSGN